MSSSTFESSDDQSGAPSSAGANKGSPSAVSEAALNQAIERLDGITHARALFQNGEVNEIHVMAQRDRKPKSVVRNIETLLLVEFGLRIDHRCISVVQMRDRPATGLMRPIIKSIVQRREDTRRIVTVELKQGTEVVRGISKLEESESELVSGSLALIRAVEQLISPFGSLELRDTGTQNLYGRELIFVVLVWTSKGSEETLVGAALSGPDRIASAARAALDAINRKMARLPEAPNT